MASSYVDRGAREYEGSEVSGRPPREIERSEVSGRDPHGFVPNEDLGEPPSTRLVRAPGDADALSCSEDGTVCFACGFVKTKANKDPFNLAEAEDAFTDMQKMIDQHYNKGISNPALVDMIYEFYNAEIRPLGDYGAWTRISIGRHLLYHRNDEDVMVNEVVNMLYAQVQSLRNKVWVENVLDGCVEPHIKNLTTLNQLVNTMTSTLGKRKALRS